jgi:hypothetical protein
MMLKKQIKMKSFLRLSTEYTLIEFIITENIYFGKSTGIHRA